MRHVSKEQLVAAAEGEPGADAQVHLAACGRCQQQVDRMRAALGALRATEVPEPSPLFWDHLARRVRERIDAEDASARSWVTRAPAISRARWTWAAAVLVVAAAIGAGQLVGRPAAPSATSSPIEAQASWLEDAGPGDLPDDAGWEAVVDVATTVEWDASPSADLQPGAAEGAVLELNADERRELLRLLQAELARPVS